MDTVNILNRILGYYSIFLIVFGTIGNLISCFVCLQKELRAISTYVFLAFITISDTVSLYLWNLDTYLFVVNGYILSDLSRFSCKIVTIIQCVTFQFSAWTLVALTIERYLCIVINKWREIYFNSRTAVIFSSVLFLVILLINGNLLFTLDSQAIQIGNITTVLPCYLTSTFTNWMKVNIYIYSLVPFFILAVTNGLLIHKAIKNRNKVANVRYAKKKFRTMNLSITIFTLLFIMLTMPQTVIGGYLAQKIVQFKYGLTVIYLIADLVFTYNSSNFLVLWKTNKKFETELNKIIFRNRTIDISSIVLATRSARTARNLNVTH